MTKADVQARADGQTHGEKLAGEIADAILVGAFAPGMKLDEQMLAERFAVSRTPVREALRQLAATGLITLRPRRGATVAKVTREQLDGLFVAMGEMEATCARLAALSMTPVERRRLQALHEQMGTLVRAAVPDAFAAANVTFHMAICTGAHNQVLADFTAGLRRRLAPFRRAQFRTPGRVPRAYVEHDAVVQAILGADAARAHAAMLHHVSLVEDAVEAYAAISAA